MTKRTRNIVTPTAKGDERRAAILAACESLLAEQSFTELKISEIAERAGVTRPGFYFYFATKAAAVTALLADLTAELGVAASAWYDGEGDPYPRLLDGMEKSVAIWRRDASLFAALLEAAAVDAEAGDAWQAFFDGFCERVTQRIEADVGDELRALGAPTPAELSAALTSLAFHTMERDVRSVLRTGRGIPNTASILAWSYLRTIYGRTP